MKRIVAAFLLALFAGLSANSARSADFKVKATGVQTFQFADKGGKNQMLFYSKAPVEDIVGSANGIGGSISFDPAAVAKSIKGEITVQVNSMTTGIGMRDEHLKGEAWLNAAQYPAITFTLRELKKVKILAGNRLEAMATGDLALRGVTKSIAVPVTLIYWEESEKTKMRMPGDLLQLRTKFSVKLADFGIKGMGGIIGNKVGETIDIELGIVGSNAAK